MVSSSSPKLLFRRLLAGRSLPSMVPRSLSSTSSFFFSSPVLPSATAFYCIRRADLLLCEFPSVSSRLAFFCSHPSQIDEEAGPAAIDYQMLVSEDEFHRVADSTLYNLQEKFEEYGDSIQSDGFDIDFGNQVLTLKLGNLGTYVINKQTPNRQIWLSSPVSGPSRFDWDQTHKAWVYRRTKANLLSLLEDEVESLCGKPITLS
ncbi:frataxin, mitochondrial [Dendrobium catenatum]|uniref:frataxin, mitochondrial n=1 Tax=Dendrobium catenatum TaxID=906689 RepID=UPI0009F478D6|nr:frataxin, mitochondrial [Dendrobium catenatum]